MCGKWAKGGLFNIFLSFSATLMENTLGKERGGLTETGDKAKAEEVEEEEVSEVETEEVAVGEEGRADQAGSK